MIDLKQLVAAIHASVSNAASAVRAQNLEIFGEFFEDFGDPDDLVSLAERLTRVSADLSETDDPTTAAVALSKALNAIKEAVSAWRDDGADPKRCLQPKMVTLKYPVETAEGPSVHPVTVPLIALAPLSSFQLSSLRFATDLDLELVNDVLQVGFPGKEAEARPTHRVAGRGAGAEPRCGGPHRASLEIEIESAAPPRGLEILVEGYERALRAQIPG